MERNNKEKYVQIDQETSTNKIFAMLDKIESDNESDINKLLEESDTEYVAEEPVPKTKEDSHNILIPEANIHIEGTASWCNTEPPKKKLKKKVDSLKRKRTAKLIKPNKCDLKVKTLFDLPETPSLLLTFESNTSLNNLVTLIFEQANLYAA